MQPRIRIALPAALLLSTFALPGQGLSFAVTHDVLSRSPIQFALGDVDGDGDLDIVSDGTLHLNDGIAIFTAAQPPLVPRPTGIVTDIVLGDMDGDGLLDALVVQGGSANVIYLGDGTGRFTPSAEQLPHPQDWSRTAALEDIDNDGDLDIFVSYAGLIFGEQNRLYLNDGTGVYSDDTSLLPRIDDRTHAIAFGDVDGDGDRDVLIGNDLNYAGEQNRLYLNDGTGDLTDVTAGALPTRVDETTGVAFGDFDADGDLDAVIGNNGQNVLLENDGTGVFTDVTPSQFPADSTDTRGIRVGDMDKDGDLDIVTGNCDLPEQPPQHRFYANDGTGVFTEETQTRMPQLAACSTTIAIADLDGDSDLDVVSGGRGLATPAGAVLFLNDGAGTLTDITTINMPADPNGSNGIDLGDVDGDADTDIVIASIGLRNRLLLNDGTGVFADVSAANMPIDFGFTCAAALGDVDGDGDLDIITGKDRRQNHLYLNDGSGVYADATPTHMPPDSDATRDVELADLDGDGDLDAFVANYNEPDRLYLNDGSGVFSDAATQLPPSTSRAEDVELADLDGDGDIDVMVANYRQLGALYLNDGTGVFSNASATHLPGGFPFARALALADVDGDGDLDVMIGNEQRPNQLWLNNGSGVFSDVSSGHLPGFAERTNAIAFGDVDADGDLDAIIGHDGDPSRILLNNGAGVFRAAPPQTLPRTSDTCDVAVADLDRDGDRDVVIIHEFEQNIVASNLARQLAWRGPPRVGKRLTFDMNGPALGFWILTVALGAQAPVIAAGRLDAQGHESFGFPVPNQPSLIGAEVRWRAIVAFPIALTNEEITRLSGL